MTPLRKATGNGEDVVHGGPPIGDHYAVSEAEIDGIMTQYVVGVSGITG